MRKDRTINKKLQGTWKGGKKQHKKSMGKRGQGCSENPPTPVLLWTSLDERTGDKTIYAPKKRQLVRSPKIQKQNRKRKKKSR